MDNNLKALIAKATAYYLESFGEVVEVTIVNGRVIVKEGGMETPDSGLTVEEFTEALEG